MGILRITMRKTSSHSVSGAFTRLIVPRDAASNPTALPNLARGAKATS
jgi:hypothetical protein